jgi:hypothetical protein
MINFRCKQFLDVDQVQRQFQEQLDRLETAQEKHRRDPATEHQDLTWSGNLLLIRGKISDIAQSGATRWGGGLGGWDSGYQPRTQPGCALARPGLMAPRVDPFGALGRHGEPMAAHCILVELAAPDLTRISSGARRANSPRY